jgi:hypothetical protein
VRLQDGEAAMKRRTARNRLLTRDETIAAIGKSLAAVQDDAIWRVTDSVNHPTHYNAHPSGVECITVTEHMNFNLGNAVKYVWRAGLKSEDPITDLKKARWYLDREIARLEKAKP